MLTKLFQRLTVDAPAGAPLFDWASRTAREPGWYLDGEVPDTIDGRFAMLATIAALVVVRLEQLGEPGERLSVALTERFAEVMESEHRELGIGEPSLGKIVLKLVGSLGRRVELWRSADGATSWAGAARDSLPAADDAAALSWRSDRLRLIAESLKRSGIEGLAKGDVQ